MLNFLKWQIFGVYIFEKLEILLYQNFAIKKNHCYVSNNFVVFSEPETRSFHEEVIFAFSLYCRIAFYLSTGAQWGGGHFW